MQFFFTLFYYSNASDLLSSIAKHNIYRVNNYQSYLIYKLVFLLYKIETKSMNTQSEDSNRSRSTNRPENISYQQFLDMETLCDRLVMLDYEAYVVKSLKMRPINR